MVVIPCPKFIMTMQLAVFDMAGTTISDDNVISKTFQMVFDNNGYDISIEEINPLMGYHKPQAIQMMFEKLNEEYDDELIYDIQKEFENEMLDYYLYDPAVKPLPAAEEVFQTLKEKGIRIALNTGFSKNIADAIVRRLQWKEKRLVDDYIASDEVALGRPHPHMLHRLMDRSGIIVPSVVIKIGDTEVDINEGRNANCGLVVAVTTGAFTREQLEQYKPDYILDSLAELPILIK